MDLTKEQIQQVLAANNVAANKADNITAALLLLGSAPPLPIPLSADEKRAILHFAMDKSDVTRWPGWTTRETQARVDMPAFFTYLDALYAAKMTLLGEVSKLMATL